MSSNSKLYELTMRLFITVVAVGITSYLLPYVIEERSRRLALRDSCVESLIDVRAASLIAQSSIGGDDTDLFARDILDVKVGVSTARIKCGEVQSGHGVPVLDLAPETLPELRESASAWRYRDLQAIEYWASKTLGEAYQYRPAIVVGPGLPW